MKLSITLLPSLLAVCRLPSAEPIPSWVRGRFMSVTRTTDELSIVCDDDAVPGHVQAARGWRALVVAGPIPFETTGVAAALVSPLAEAEISVFLVATFDTDYLLVRAADLTRAASALRGAGHEVVEDSTATVENERL
jgi:uncharacterized protein